MKTMMRRFLTVLPLMAATTVFGFESQVVGGVTWYYNVIPNGFQKCAVVIGCKPSSLDSALIPSVLGDNPVVRIGEWAFDSKYLTSVTIPSSVTSIEEGAFCQTDLVSVSIPSNVMAIGEQAFRQCSGLKTVTIAGGTMSIGRSAFGLCGSLTSVTIEFGVMSIGEYAFASCEDLTSLVVPSSVTNIGYAAFANCRSLNSVQFEGPPPKGVAEACFNTGSAIRYNVKYNDEWVQVVEECGWTNALPYEPAVEELKADGGPYKEVVDGVEWTFMVKNHAAELCSGSSFSFTPAISSTTEGSLSIPRFLGGRPVAKIGNYAFYGCKRLTSVKIPPTVTDIGYWAFRGCSRISSLTLPSCVTSIGEMAFDGCSGLTEFDFPASLCEVGSFAFAGCDNLKVANIQDLAAWCEIKFNGYDGFPLENVERFFDNGEETSVLFIPHDVARIGQNAFYGCKAFVTIAVPGTTKEIGHHAFCGCMPAGAERGGTDRLHVLLYDGVEKIDYDAFCGCKWLVDVDLPSSVTEIGDSAFEGCVQLDSVDLPSSVTKIGSSAFEGCVQLDSVVLHEGLTAIGRCAFRNCSALCSANIPQSVEWVGDSVFAGTKYWEGQNKGVVVLDGCALGLKGDSPSYLVVSDGVRVIASSAFEGCTATSLSLPSSLRHIGGSAFQLSSIRAVELPCGVETIGAAAFCNCSQLKSATIPESVRVIENKAFRVCSNLETVQLSEGLECVGREAFYECEKLSGIALPDTVTSIGDYAFYGCSGMWSAEIGAGIQSIGREAFEGCVELRSLALYGAPANLGVWAFGGYGKDYRYLDAIKIKDLKTWCANEFGDSNVPLWFTKNDRPYSKLLLNGEQISELLEIPDGVTRIGASTFEYLPIKELKLPPSVTSVGRHAFNGCPYLANVYLSEGLKDIDDRAFYSCKALGEISIPASVERVGQDSFRDCNTLSNIFFMGDAPTAVAYGGRELEPDESLRIGTTPCKIIVLEGSEGWDEDGDGKWHGLEVVIRQTPSYVITYENLRGAANSNPIAYKATDEIVFANLNDREDARFIGWNPAKIERGSTGDKTVVACWETKTVSDLLKGCGDVALSGAADWSAKWTGLEWILQSGTIGDRQNSILSCMVEGAGTLSFKWKVSSECEEGCQDDYLNFVADGEEIAWIGGEKGWIEKSILLGASDIAHTLSWSYIKDKVGVAGDDCGWLKDIVWTPSAAEPIPELGASADAAAVQVALEGSADAKLAANITDAATYNAYREWALKIGAAGVKASPFAWVSFATDSAALLAKMPTDDDLKVAEFKPSATAGSFDFTVSVKDVTIGDKASEDNLKKLFGLEGAESLAPAAFSSENVALDFKEPQDGKLKFTATPAVDNAKSFFMKAKVK